MYVFKAENLEHFQVFVKAILIVHVYGHREMLNILILFGHVCYLKRNS